MANPVRGQRIDERLVGEATVFGPFVVRPVARVSGRLRGDRRDAFAWTWGQVRVVPEEVEVIHSDGSEEHVPILEDATLFDRGLLGRALIIAAICASVFALRRLVGELRP